MSANSYCGYLVFTDLDGSLLDHHTYSAALAQPQLRRLAQLGVPVIPTSSKTRVEIEVLMAELELAAPFISENGAAVYIPQGYFPQQPADTHARDGYWVHAGSPPRADWLQLLAQLGGRYAGQFRSFDAAGVEGVMAMTGLDATGAWRANQREYSEPLQWLGDDTTLQTFVAELQAHGATVTRGGRFLSVSGDCSKGRALVWLRETYRQTWPEYPLHDLAVGDSGNDVPMLEAAQTALLVRSPVHDFPVLARTGGVHRSSDYGPAGWAQGVASWLDTFLELAQKN